MVSSTVQGIYGAKITEGGREIKVASVLDRESANQHRANAMMLLDFSFKALHQQTYPYRGYSGNRLGPGLGVDYGLKRCPFLE